MAVQTQSGYVRAARQRWPQAAIEGDGSFALVSYCCEAKYVRLYSTYLEAGPLARESCGHAYSRMAHRVYRIEELRPVPQYIPSGLCDD